MPLMEMLENGEDQDRVDRALHRLLLNAKEILWPNWTARAMIELQKILNDQIPGLQKRDEQNPKISCKRGCAHCCYMNVDIWIGEALLLLTTPQKMNWALIERRAAMAESLARENRAGQWIKRPIDQRACVYLNRKKRCTIYANRPMACRTYFVVSEPQLCDTRRVGKVKTATNTFSEILISVSHTLGCMSAAGSLPVMLKLAQEILTSDSPRILTDENPIEFRDRTLDQSAEV